MEIKSIYNIQLIRATAAISVAYYHLQAMVNDAYSTSLKLDFPSFGVDLFFVVSGFVMFISNSKLDRPAAKFMWERLVRIVPLYWLSTLLIVALYQIGFHPNGLNYFEPHMLLQSLFFIKSEFPDGRLDLVLNLGWTLVYELFFYAMFAMTFKLKSIDRSFSLLLLTFSVLVSIGFIYPAIPKDIPFFLKPIILEFLLGCFLGLIFLRWQKFDYKPPPIAGPIGLGLITLGTIPVLVLEIYHINVSEHEILRPFLWGPCAFFIVAGVILLEQRDYIIRSRLVLLLGAASYSLYLFHPVVMQSTVKIIYKLFSGQSILNAIIAIFGAMIATAIVSIIINLTIEATVLKAGRFFINKIYNRRSSLAEDRRL